MSLKNIYETQKRFANRKIFMNFKIKRKENETNKRKLKKETRKKLIKLAKKHVSDIRTFQDKIESFHIHASIRFTCVFSRTLRMQWKLFSELKSWTKLNKWTAT